MNYWLFTIPLLSASIGWIIVRMAVTLLFHPRQPKRFLGRTIQGIFPKQQRQLGEKIGRLVRTEFFSAGQIEQKVSDPENLKKVLPLIDEHVEDFLRNKMKDQMPMLSMFIGDKTITMLKTVFMREIENLFPVIMQKFASNLKEELDLEKIVAAKIAGFSSDKLEALFSSSLAKELRFVGIIGGFVGLLVGLLQVAIILLTS